MLTVSVNAYDDADLLAGCLASVRETLPHARIQVIDGRYESFRPDAADNSTDDTMAVCDAYGAEYWPDGPFDDESSKHWGRVARAPDGDRILFMDADERLLTFDEEPVPEHSVGRVRIHNALMYDHGDVTYYPRYFYPRQLEGIPRVDRFSFDAPVERTDRITIIHRADLRSEAYREAKLERFDREDRGPWYKEYLEAIDEHGFDLVDFDDCPNCGEESVTKSRLCGYDGDRITWVETCTAHDRCYNSVKEFELEKWQYVPDRVGEGFDEDIQRVRAELMMAGNSIAAVVGDEAFRRYEPNAKLWVKEEFDVDAKA